jgi:hypothetical protein
MTFNVGTPYVAAIAKSFKFAVFSANTGGIIKLHTTFFARGHFGIRFHTWHAYPKITIDSP